MLVGYGLWVVDGITRFDVPGDENYYVTRQAIAAVLGVCGMIVAALVPLDLVRRYWKVVYGATLALMVIVFVAAETIRGSKRWIDIGVIQFQPSELGKVLFVLAIAGFVVERANRVSRWKTVLQTLGLGRDPDPPRLPAAGPRDGPRLRGRPLRDPLLRRRALAPAA